MTTPPLPANPFIAGPAIKDRRLFVGRDEALQAIISRLETAQPISVNVVGSPRIGKSSLLVHLAHTWAERVPATRRAQVVLIYLRLEAVHHQADFFKRISDKLTAANAGPTVSLTHNYHHNFGKLLQQFAEANLRPVLCLDDFHTLFDDPELFDTSFFEFLRSLMDDSRLMLVAATDKPIYEYKADHNITSSFFNNGHIERLENLAADDVTHLLNLPHSIEASQPPALSPEQQEQARQWGGQHPFLLQLAASYLYEAQQRNQPVSWAHKRFVDNSTPLLPPPPPGLGQRLWLAGRQLVIQGPIWVGQGLQDKQSPQRLWVLGLVLILLVVAVLLGLIGPQQLLTLGKSYLGVN